MRPDIDKRGRTPIMRADIIDGKKNSQRFHGRGLPHCSHPILTYLIKTISSDALDCMDKIIRYIRKK